MATDSEIDLVKRNTDGADGWTHTDISTQLDSGLTVAELSRTIWTSKAAEFASLVTTSESGSTRQLSDMHKNALAMAKHFGDQQAVEVPDLPAVIAPRTRKITRG